MVRLLLEHKADINAKDMIGQMALHYAAMKEYGGIVQLLLEHKADANMKTTTQRQTPLHFAANGGCVEMVRLLLEYKANAGAKNGLGSTALDGS